MDPTNPFDPRARKLRDKLISVVQKEADPVTAVMALLMTGAAIMRAAGKRSATSEEFTLLARECWTASQMELLPDPRT